MDLTVVILQLVPGAWDAIQEFYNSPWMRVITSLSFTAGLIATATPNKVDNAVIQFIRQLIEWMGLNFGNAKSIPTPKK